MSGSDCLSNLKQDLKLGARMLAKSPGFTLAAIITLALGVGGNTAIFTVTNALLLRAFPYRDPSRLVMLNSVRKGSVDQGGGDFSLNRYELIRDRNHSFSGVAVFAIDSFNLTGRGEPEQVSAVRISPNFFDVLGVSPQLGRAFTNDDGQIAGPPVVMISDALWRTHFGGDRGIVGQSVALDSQPFTIIGVLPAGIQFPFVGQADVWSPRYFELSLMTPEHLRAGVGYLTPIARLSPGASLKQANAEMDVLQQQYSQAFPKEPEAGTDVSTVAGNLQELTVANVHTLFIVLSIAVGLVLMIACANVASLMLSRALARGKEIAIRSALGARRSVIIRQLLVESMLLALISGTLGLGLGIWGTKLLGSYGQANLPTGFEFSIDGRVLIFTLLVSVGTGLVFGSFPALKLVRTNINSELRDEGRGTTGSHKRMQAKNLLVIFQIAVCMLLVIGASLMIQTFANLQRVELGFDPANVLSMNVSLPTVKYAKPEQQIAFFDELLRKVNAVPGVRSASISAALPLKPKRITPILPEGQPEVPLGQRPFIIIEAIGTRWFETMRVPMKMGRAFSDSDNAQAPRVVIINEALARRFWPNENPVGKHIIVGRGTESEVVGVAGHVKNNGLAVDSEPQLYLPFPKLPWGNMNLLVRSTTDPHQLISTLRQQVYAVDPDQPITQVQTMDELLANFRAQPRFTVFLLSSLSSMALILAIVGIYGVISYTVGQRRHELGIRMALGAERNDVLLMIVARGLFLTMIGIVAGLIAAVASTRVMESLLYHVRSHDLTTFALASLLFLVVGTAASYLPARRAMSVDPREALRGS
jgi:putative ABC transport system permease protein